ncbi:MAG TPA: hypothetical protein ENI07_24730 [Desulfobacterales bacterium]|nr:hypothetical protein [Desulfobacterales bacterium]
MAATIYRQCFKCEKHAPENDILKCEKCQQEFCTDCIDLKNPESNAAYCDSCFGIGMREQVEEDQQDETDEEFFENEF